MSSNVEANLRHIAKHEAKPNPKPIPYTTITRGFEAVAFPKIVRELKDDNLIVKQKSLLAARELLGTGTSYVQCIAHGITPAVMALLSDPDAVVRERAAVITEYIASKEVGARDIKQHGGVPLLVGLLEDGETKVRDAAYNALIEAARFDSIRLAVVEMGTALATLMKLVLGEPHTRSLAGLKLLNACVQVRHNIPALVQMVEKANAIPSLAQLISEDRPEDIQEQAALLLGILVSNLNDAKVEAWQNNCVPKLIALLATHQSNVLLASAAAHALMLITVLREAKFQVLDTKAGVMHLCSCLEPDQEQLCLNAAQIIANVAEAPDARPVLLEAGALERLVSILQGDHVEHIKRAAAEALRQCNFKTLPHAPLPGRTVNADDFPEAEVARILDGKPPSASLPT